MRTGGAICCLVFTAVLSLSTRAAAEARLVLLAPGAELERAVRTALNPWHVVLVVVPVGSPGPTAPTTHEVARAIALENDASGVVWVSAHASGHAIWLYDRESAQVVARPLRGGPPFDAPTAAALALTVKTLLRHSHTAPASERFGVVAPAAEVPDFTPVAREEARVAPARSPFELEGSAGARARALRGLVQARFGVGLGWWAGALGITLRASFGPRAPIDESALRGSFRDYGAALFTRLRWHVRERLRIVVSGGALADVTRVKGTLRLESRALAPITRIVPALGIELEVAWLPREWLRVGARAGAAWTVRTQRYLVQGEPVLELSRVPLELGLLCAVGFPR